MPQQMIADAHRRGRFEIPSLGIEIQPGAARSAYAIDDDALAAIIAVLDRSPLTYRDALEARDIAIAARIVADPANADRYAREAGVEVDA